MPAVEPPQLFDTVGAAAKLRELGAPFSHRTLERYRLTGNGPRFRRLGGRLRGRVYYALTDLEAWIEGAVRTSTADTGQRDRRGRAASS